MVNKYEWHHHGENMKLTKELLQDAAYDSGRPKTLSQLPGIPKFTVDDIAVGGTVIYPDKVKGVYKYSKVKMKDLRDVLRLENGDSVRAHEVVSTDFSDWKDFKKMVLSDSLKECKVGDKVIYKNLKGEQKTSVIRKIKSDDFISLQDGSNIQKKAIIKVMEAAEDDLLEYLTKAHRAVIAHGGLDTYDQRTVDRIYETMRSYLKDGDVSGFINAYSEAAAKHPDAFDFFIDEVLAQAGVNDIDKLFSKVGIREEVMAEAGIMKKLARGVKGWAAFDKDGPTELVKRNKAYDDETIKLLRNPSAKVTKGSPADLQQRVLDREAKRRGLTTEQMHDEDEEDDGPQEFYVAFYDKDEDRAWIGMVIKDENRWVEKKFKGEPEYRWGQRYMSYLSPDEVMSWIHKDYGRGMEIKGPFMDENEAIDYVEDHWGDIKEAVSSKALSLESTAVDVLKHAGKIWSRPARTSVREESKKEAKLANIERLKRDYENAMRWVNAPANDLPNHERAKWKQEAERMRQHAKKQYGVDLT